MPWNITLEKELFLCWIAEKKKKKACYTVKVCCVKDEVLDQFKMSDS